MAISPPKTVSNKPVSEEEIEKHHQQTDRSENYAPVGEEDQDDELPKSFTIHTNVRMIKEINELRKKRPRKPGSPKLGISINDWMIEAASEKIKRDKKKK